MHVFISSKGYGGSDTCTVDVRGKGVLLAYVVTCDVYAAFAISVVLLDCPSMPEC